ncbi:hypothetical protein [Actinoplanes sp. NPDC049265]|uniref:hypothetical protein n=1 Tax=Actinoplanes sp. NPDC049265 TaxID=3363902 RepID=UPI0037219BDC
MRGDFRKRQVVTLRENVECPSLSPDGTRIAFKEAVGGDPARGWRLSVLDLKTQSVPDLKNPPVPDLNSQPVPNLKNPPVPDLKTHRVTHTAETSSVDDQAAWLDDATLAYTLRQDDGTPDIYEVRADGTGAPRLLVRGAESPSTIS